MFDTLESIFTVIGPLLTQLATAFAQTFGKIFDAVLPVVQTLIDVFVNTLLPVFSQLLTAGANGRCANA